MKNLDLYTDSQRNAILHDNGNMLVSASAGSGKTMVVIQRILRLITEGNVSVDKILAVTFTNAAASEMKEKLKSEILKLLSEKNDAFLKSQLDKINTASISTIHSFCYDLIKRYFYEIGLDASVKLVDEKENDKIASEALDSLFDRLYEENNQDFFETLTYFTKKRKDGYLRSLILSLYKFSDSESDLNEVYRITKTTHENVYDLMFNKVFKKAVLELNGAQNLLTAVINSFSVDEKRKGFSIALNEKLNALKDAKTPEEFIELYETGKVSLPSSKVLEVEATDNLKYVYALINDICGEVKSAFSCSREEIETKAKKGLSVVEKLFNLTTEFKNEYQNLKTENNVVDFSDLQKYALKLLENESILKDVKSRYEYIFVDEYQDVNDIQERLVNLISSNNLFMVGDSKQSIYAFRGCNPKFFIEKYKNYTEEQGGKAISLDNNFRSSSSVINTVNNIFSDVFTQDFSGLDYAKNPMIYGELYKNYKGKAVYHLINDKPKIKEENQVKGVYSVIENYNPKTTKEYGEEEGLVVNLINDIVGKEYYDIKEKDENKRIKKFTYGDICILARSNNGLVTSVLSALRDSNIPTTVGGKKSIGEYPEVKVLISLVSALCFINQDIPLATIMLNLWDFTEEELTIIREKRGRNQSFYESVKALSTGGSELSNKLNNFLLDFDRIRLIAEFVSANEILTKVVSETEWDAKLLSQPFGVEKLKRVERFIAESIIGENKMNVKEFNDYIAKSVEDITVTEVAGDDTVKFMTEHSSKGLEYPCVIVIGNDTTFNSSDVKSTFILDRDYGIVTKIYNPDTMIIEDNPVASVIKAEYKIKRAVEEARVLYVALTRAKCELHVIARAKNVKELREPSLFTKANKPSDFLSQRDTECVFYNGEDLVLTVDSQGVAVAGNKINENLSSMIRENLTYTYPHLNDTVIPLKTSVSDVNNNLEDEYFKTITIFTSDNAERGTAYHKVLEKINFYAEDLSTEIDKVLNGGDFTEREKSFIDKAKVLEILSMEIFKQIKDYSLFKEKKFYCLVDGTDLGYLSSQKVLVQGIIDLLCEKDNEIILIDYKLSSIESDIDLIKKYKMQLLLYKRAVETITGKKVTKTYLINILQNRIVEL